MKKHLSFALLLFGFLVFSQSTSGNLISLNGGMSVKLDTNATTATLTLTGPSDSWLGIGFGGTSMSSVSDMFIWNATTNRDYTPSGGTSAPSADAAQSWVVSSDNVSGTTRTIVATRALVSTGNFTFINDTSPIQIIANRGNSNINIGYHGFNNNRTITNITRGVLGTNEIISDNLLSVIYPNPANDFFEIQSVDKINAVIIFDAAGKKVRNFNSSLEKYDISSLKSGVYFLEIINNKGISQFEKLIKK
ncbi:T9SS type A sorting domain-containing protein [Frigoriflavimonas asaccharolytica]|uniref:Secretion system C-terminal sorting domain-containing protein n=1 Tax=Frigoriflavimonas asaccharolytica TaxID=2735899 RepID=A0A8J8GAX3_9FLAO|nr:T9SS type A sorting domain-containing protein [Frigoriflavimonas asaccharolytica]NRS92605.1 hypothetical protein [Frigoriflavimonas asaccharolytica]